MNRKLIRQNLADVKNQERDSQNNRVVPHRDSAINRTPIINSSKTNTQLAETVEATAQSASKNRRPPQIETNAEIFYYKKQIDSRTLMIIVLQDGEEIEGTIEWYDRNALKINRQNSANILLLKHNIKYMFKAEDRASQD